MLTIENVSKSYGKLKVLDNLSLNLPNKGLVALVGENGCGKTTLLNLISTVDYAYTGKIAFSGIKFESENYHLLRNKVISYIQQDNKFIGSLSIAENIEINDSDDAKVRKWLSDFKIAEKYDAKPDELSGGQRQKCSFIRGILKESQILLVDEPTSNMDKEAERNTFQILKEIAKEKLVVMVSHNMNLIEEFSNLIVMMGQGKILSVMENNNETNILSEDNLVKVSDNTETAFLHEWIKIKKLLFEKREITLKLFTKSKTEEDKLDYSDCECEQTLRKTDSKKIKTFAQKDLRYKLGSNLIMYILGILFLCLVTLCIFLSRVNEAKFEQDMFAASDYKFVNFAEGKVISAFYSKKKMFYYENYTELINEYGPVATFTKGGVNVRFPYDSDDIYNSVVTGFTYFPKGFDFDLLCGTYPNDEQILITDYIADYLLKYSELKSYEDIISSGFNVAHYQFDVAGIIKMNYQDFFKNQTMKELQQSDKYTQWQYYQENLYSHFFINDSVLDIETHDFIPFVIGEWGEIVVDINFLEDENQFSKANQSLSELLPYYTDEQSGLQYTELKTVFGRCGIVDIIDDGRTNPTMYVNHIYKMLEFDFSYLNTEDSIQFYSNQREPYEFLTQYKLVHYTPVSDAINRTEEIVRILREYLVPFTFILLAVASVFTIFLWIKQEEKNKFAIYSFRMNGYSDRQIAVWYLVKYAALCVFELIGTAVLFFASGILLNRILSKIAGCNVVLMTFDILKVFIAFGLFALIIFAFVTLYFFINVRKAPIKLYGEK